MARKRRRTARESQEFGSAAWAARLLRKRLTGTEEQPAEPISTVADYLSLAKLRRLIWVEEQITPQIVWEKAEWEAEEPLKQEH